MFRCESVFRHLRTGSQHRTRGCRPFTSSPGSAVVSMTAPSRSPLDEPPGPALVVGSMPCSTKNKNTQILSSIPLHQWTVQQPRRAPLPFGPPRRPRGPRLTSQPARSLLSLVTRCPPDTAHGRGQLNSHCSPLRVRSLVGHHRCDYLIMLSRSDWTKPDPSVRPSQPSGVQ